MRMEELSDSRYVKGTDTVERYLLGLVQDYFKDGAIAMNTSREFIIKKALKRMKEELNFEDIGVLSITLPDGRVLTGPVTLTVEDLGGEPKIENKGSAFNVDFGDQQNTACEGNDPRLSDPRKPLPHTHDVDDIIGLKGLLSTLSGTINRVNGFAHEHKNRAVLDMITYSGNKSIIDIGAIDATEERVQKLVQEVKKLIKDYQDNIPIAAKDVYDTAQEVSQKLSDIQVAVNKNNDTCLQQARLYAEDEFKKVTTQFNASTGGGGYVVKSKLDNVLQNSISLAGSMDISLGGLGSNTPITKALDSNIVAVLMSRQQNINDCHFEFHFKQKDSSGKTLIYSMPHMVISNSQLVGQVIPSYFVDASNNIQICITFEPFITGATVSLTDSSVSLDVYAKQEVTV